jgi:hypothetical protein
MRVIAFPYKDARFWTVWIIGRIIEGVGSVEVGDVATGWGLTWGEDEVGMPVHSSPCVEEPRARVGRPGRGWVSGIDENDGGETIPEVCKRELKSAWLSVQFNV